MDNQENLQNRQLHKKYHLDRSWHIRLSRLVLLITLVAFTILASMLFVFPNLWIVHPLFACLPWFGFVILLLLGNIIGRYVNYAHLSTTQEGIEYNTSLGYSIYTLWENIKRIDRIRFGFWTVEGLILSKPEVRGWRWGSWYHQRKKDYHIPITPFVENWRSMELGNYLKPYINLQDNNKEETMEPNEQFEREQREEKRRQVQKTQDKIKKVIYIGFGIFLIIACLWGFITSLLNP